MKKIEYEDDVVFARFINYMKKAFAHRKINYLKHKEILRKTELSISDCQFNIYENEINAADTIIEVETKRIKFYKINKSMKLLTKKQRKVLELNYLKNMMLKDIGAELNISTKAAEQLKARAIKRLKESLKNFNEGDD